MSPTTGSGAPEEPTPTAKERPHRFISRAFSCIAALLLTCANCPGNRSRSPFDSTQGRSCPNRITATDCVELVMAFCEWRCLRHTSRPILCGSGQPGTRRAAKRPSKEDPANVLLGLFAIPLSRLNRRRLRRRINRIDGGDSKVGTELGGIFGGGNNAPSKKNVLWRQASRLPDPSRTAMACSPGCSGTRSATRYPAEPGCHTRR
jgi:hypothetical protein